MGFRGLFIGVERFASPRISWLTCAGRDARALHALFADTLGPGGELLTNDAATREELRTRFEALANCDADDVVVVSSRGTGRRRTNC